MNNLKLILKSASFLLLFLVLNPASASGERGLANPGQQMVVVQVEDRVKNPGLFIDVVPELTMSTLKAGNVDKRETAPVVGLAASLPQDNKNRIGKYKASVSGEGLKK